MAETIGIPYDQVRWQSVPGQPFGLGAGYNGIIFGNLSNIVDIEGPIAVMGNVTSYRGMSIGFGREGRLTIPYSAQAVRFLAGGDVAIGGALTVVGNVLTAGSSFQAGAGSTYLIGKDGEANQRETLAALYAVEGYPAWEPADHGDTYIVSSYDTPRRIPASRVDADVSGFFAAAKQNMACWQEAFAALTANGTAAPAEYGYQLLGTDETQNVFDLTWPEEGSLTGDLRLNVPQGSRTIVRIYSGDTMTVTTPLWGSEALAAQTIYVLMNAKTVNLPFPSAIYGSVFAPNTAWNALTTGGNINGTAALGSLWVQEGSGFELHWYPFEGDLNAGEECTLTPAPPAAPECPVCPDCETCPVCPVSPTIPGVIAGCVLPNGQCTWRVKLCDQSTRQVLSVWQGCGMGCFSFEVNPEGRYFFLLEICCHYELRFNNVGVRSLGIKG